MATVCLARDLGSFLFAEANEEEGSSTLVLNFTEELKALVPR